MEIRAVLLLLGIVCHLLYCGKAEGGHRKLSREEELEIEKQLKRINEATLKTIKAQSGDIYDCIDFYKQPAFDHPLLKNHSFHFKMRPSSRPKTIMNKIKPSKIGQQLLKIGLQGEGCPIGTVPIRRTTKNDLIRAKIFTKTYASKFSLAGADKPWLHRAVLQTKDNPNKKYNGGGTVMSVYQPSVSSSQYSSSQMTIKNGLDSIQVGWTVNPSLYGDNNTRLFTFFTAGTLSCFNTQCSGFIIVDTEIPLDSILSPISERGKYIQGIHFFVYRDQISGNWWLEIGENFTQIGFWPPHIFSSLKDLATYLDWGGEAYGPPGESGPEMGSGFTLVNDVMYDSFCANVTTINEDHDPVDDEETEVNGDEPPSYRVLEKRNSQDIFGQVVLFGGRGPS